MSNLTPYWPFFAIGVAIMALFFWGRGMIRPNRSDMIAGFLAFVVTCALVFAVNENFAMVGLFVIAFGGATLVLSRFAHPKCSLSKSERAGLGTLAICVGVLIQLLL